MQIPVQKIGKQIARFIPYLGILILLILLNRQCQNAENIFTFYENEKQQVEHYKNKLGSITASVNTLEINKKQLESLLLKKDDSLRLLTSEFHKVKSIVKIKEVTKVDTVYIEFDTEIPVQFERLGKYDIDSHFKFNYALNQTGFSLSDISVPNTQTIITGTKRNWIFGKQYLTTDITNSNPYIHTKEIQTIVVPVKVEWYNNKFVWFGLGAVGGVMIAK